MGRIIQTESINAVRHRWLKLIAICIQEFNKHQQLNDDVLDMVSFMIISLEKIHETIERTITAWEKRGYWLKVEHFKKEWEWTKLYQEHLKKALSEKNWEALKQHIQTIQKKYTGKIKVSANHRYGTPWTGSWKTLHYPKEHKN